MLETPRAEAMRTGPSPSRRLAVGAVAVGIVLAAFAVRFLFIDQVSGDYRTVRQPLVRLPEGERRIRRVSGDISNYNPPYLYLLAAATIYRCRRSSPSS